MIFQLRAFGTLVFFSPLGVVFDRWGEESFSLRNQEHSWISQNASHMQMCVGLTRPANSVTVWISVL